jgi:hypothetical protein
LFIENLYIQNLRTFKNIYYDISIHQQEIALQFAMQCVCFINSRLNLFLDVVLMRWEPPCGTNPQAKLIIASGYWAMGTLLTAAFFMDTSNGNANI